MYVCVWGGGGLFCVCIIKANKYKWGSNTQRRFAQRTPEWLKIIQEKCITSLLIKEVHDKKQLKPKWVNTSCGRCKTGNLIKLLVGV